MKKSSSVLLLSSILFLNMYSQNFTIEDIEINRLRNLAPDNLNNLQWGKVSNKIVFSQADTLFEFDFLMETKKCILTMDELSKKLSVDDEVELRRFPEIECYERDLLYFIYENNMYSYNTTVSNLNKIFSLPPGFDNLSLNKNLSHAAFTLDSNIYLIDRRGNQSQITYDSVNGITNGQIVYREEFGSEKGIFWSPRGNYFAFYHKNERAVTEYPLVRIDKRVGELQNTRYPMAGMKNEITEIWIYSVAKDEIISLDIDSTFDYHTNISWNPDETAIYIQHLNREQDKMVLKSYSIPEGRFIKEFFVEKDAQYVEPLHPVIFSEKETEDFYYQSARDGFNHIYKYESKNNSLIQITKGSWEVTEFLGTDTMEANLYFMATKENPLERHLYKYNMKKQTIGRLTSGEGTHTILMNSVGDYFIDVHASFTIPGRISIIDLKGTTKSVLLDAANPVSDYELGKVIIDKMKAADDTSEIYYRLVKPVDFDSTKKYPVVVYVYGGPHVQLINNRWMGRIDYLQQYFAQNGYVSFTIDPRGSRNRGAEFEQIIHRQSGIPQLEDHLKGIDYLKTLAYIDTSRIGVHGWSYGGYMTILMMLSHPEIFKVGASGGPVIDWKYYEVMYGERYMDTPEENPDGYALTNLRNIADNLQGKLLIIHGALDPTVVWQHSLSFVQSCIENGVHPDYFVYPLHEHNVRGMDRIHLTRMITEYFFEHL